MTLDDLGFRRRPSRRPLRNLKRLDERVKLTATYLNGIAIAVIAVGVVRFVFTEDAAIALREGIWVPVVISGAFYLAALLVLSFFEGEG